jgi:hypothetical protein
MALIVNGQEIDEDVIEAEFAQIKAHYERTLQVACCERDPEFRVYAKRNITARLLLNQAAKAEVEALSEAEIDEAFAELVEEHGGEDRMYYQLGVLNRDPEVVRQGLAEQRRVERLLDSICELPASGDEELREFYESHQDLYLTDEMVRAAHISKTLSGSHSREAVYRQMREIRQRLRRPGVDFMEVAREENQHPEQDVDLGFFKRGEFMEEFEAITFSMDLGEISPVFTTQLGLHICTVLERKEAEPRPFEEVRDTVAEHLIAEARQRQMEAYVEKLKASAKIEDTGWDPEEEEYLKREAEEKAAGEGGGR